MLRVPVVRQGCVVWLFCCIFQIYLTSINFIVCGGKKREREREKEREPSLHFMRLKLLLDADENQVCHSGDGAGFLPVRSCQAEMFNSLMLPFSEEHCTSW